MGHLSFRQQLFRGCFPTVGNGLVVLSLDDVSSVDDFGVMLEVVEMVRQGLLSFPFCEVLFSELVSYVKPQCGMGGHIAPPELCSVGQPGVDVTNQGADQVTGLVEAPSV